MRNISLHGSKENAFMNFRIVNAKKLKMEFKKLLIYSLFIH